MEVPTLLCEIRSDYLCTMYNASTQAFRRRFCTTKARVQFLASPCEFCGRQSVNGTDFSLSTLFSPCQYHPTNVSYLSSSQHYVYQKKAMLFRILRNNGTF